MASWKQSFKVAYEKSRSTFVTLPDSPEKDRGRNEDTVYGRSESINDISSKGIPEQQSRLCLTGAVPKTARNPQRYDHSLPPIELNCRVKFKKAGVLPPDHQNVVEEAKYQLRPHFSLSEHSKNFDEQQQCISKDMLCTVVKDMELSSKSCEYDYMDSSGSLESILEDVSEDNVEDRCISILNFAKKCLSAEFHSQLDEADVLSLMLKNLPDILSFNDLAFCCAVLLCVLSQYPRNRENKRPMELVLLKFLQTTASRRKSDVFCSSSNDIVGYDIKSLPESVMEKSLELCKVMSVHEHWELQGINLMVPICVSVQNIFAHKGGQRSSNTDILFCIVDQIHEGVQQLSLKKQVCFAELSDYHSNLRMIWNCLQVLEQASFLHPENQRYLVSCQNSALSRNSNRMLGFCMKYLFFDSLPQSLDAQMPENDMNYNKEVQFYLRSCLVSLLKVLIYIGHNCKEAVLEIGAIDGLMEKLVMCVLSIGSQKSEEQFEVLILCLELLINLVEPIWANRRTFAIVCLKKFSGPVDSKMFAVEHLMEILAESLNEIGVLERIKDEATQGADDSSKADEAVKKSDNAKAEIVFKAAKKHMEQSMICAYISILLGFFVDIKRTFRDLVHDKMPREAVEQAVLVSKKFLNFVELTEETSQSSIKSMDVMLNTLQSIYDGR